MRWRSSDQIESAKLKDIAESKNKRRKGSASAASLYTIIPFGCVMLAVSSIIPIHYYLGRYPVETRYNLYVITPIGEWDYWMRAEDGERIYVDICKDLGFEPPFDKGETILKITYRNMGYCWSLRGIPTPRAVMDRYTATGELVRRPDRGD